MDKDLILELNIPDFHRNHPDLDSNKQSFEPKEKL